MRKIVTSLCGAWLLLSSAHAAQNTPDVPYDADLFKKDTPAFSVHGSFLYWRVQEGALDYAVKMQHASPDTLVYAQGKMHNASFNGDPGFRIAASYFRAPRYWEMWLQYTRLTARGEDSVGKPDVAGRSLTGTWPQGLFTAALDQAKSHIHMNYNVADFFVDRFFVPNPHLRIRFLGGGTAAAINQNWAINYYNTDGSSSYVRNHWKFIGGGLRLGTTVDWYCGYDIYLTSLVSGASLLGSYKNEAYQTISSNELPIRDTHFSDVRPTFTVQASFGLSWQKNFCATRMEIFGGYEINSWWNLHEVYRSGSGVTTAPKDTLINSSLIALQGLTARMTLDF